MAPNNTMNIWGNDKTMNLNHLILTNIQASPYFKVQLFELKTFHEVVDEIYYRVQHLEPWEKGSRKTAGQTGMCGGVRGVGAGGIVSSAYCLLYKLFTLKLTKKQVNNLLTHRDSPYIRGIGFMYIRYTQNPSDLWDWYEPYLDDEEELDVKAGGGHFMAIGEMLRQWLIKLEWYSTLFPRIPVPIQKDIDMKVRSRPIAASGGGYQGYDEEAAEPEHIPDDELSFGEAERSARNQGGRGGGSINYGRKDDYRNGSSSRRSPPIRNLQRRSPPRRSRTPPKRSRTPPPRRSRTPPRRSRTPPPRRSPPQRSRVSPYSRPSDDFSRELEREKNRQRRDKDREREDYKHKSSKHDKIRKRSRSLSKSRERKRSQSYEREQRRSRSRDRKEHSSKHKEHKEKKKSKHKERDREREYY